MSESPTGIEIAAGIAAAAAVAGAGVAAYGQYQQGQTANKVAQYNAELANRNAQIADQNAEAVRFAGTAKEEQSRDEVRQVLARQRALVGASGVTTEGSPLLVMMESARQGELDALRIRYATDIEEQQRLLEGQQQRSQAFLQGAQGRAAQSAGTLAAGGSILTGIGSGVSSYSSMTRPRGSGTSLLS
jgi:hypothetical protein